MVVVRPIIIENNFLRVLNSESWRRLCYSISVFVKHVIAEPSNQQLQLTIESDIQEVFGDDRPQLLSFRLS